MMETWSQIRKAGSYIVSKSVPIWPAPRDPALEKCRYLVFNSVSVEINLRLGSSAICITPRTNVPC